MTGCVSDRSLRRLATAIWWTFVVADVAAPFLTPLLGHGGWAKAFNDTVFTLIIAGYPLVGWLVLRRRPRNRLGWVLLIVGAIWTFGGVTDAYARFGLVIDPGSLPGAGVAGAFNQGIWAPALGLMVTHLLLLFPDGRLPGPRWRWASRLATLAIVCLYVSVTLEPGPMIEGAGTGMENPLGLASAGGLVKAMGLAGILLLGASALLCSAGLIVRFRRSHGLERQQLTWLAAAAGVVGSLFAVSMVITAAGSAATWSDDHKPLWAVVFTETLPVFSFVLIPVAIGTAILRHRLYDIDVVINRALVYLSLTLSLAVVYLGVVLLLRQVLTPVTGESDLAVAGSTLVVAALFGPLRKRIQAGVDRRFYRQRYDAEATVQSFNDRLRREIDLAQLTSDLQETVHDALAPRAVSVWLRTADGAVTIPGRPSDTKVLP